MPSDDAVYGDDVHQLIFLRLVDCCSLYGGLVGYGLGWVSYLVGWIGSGSMIWTYGQL